MTTDPTGLRGRGTAANPPNRFVRLAYEPEPGAQDPAAPGPATVYYRDTARTVLATNDSPDVGFTVSLNPYRGCEHGCSYCYARPYHEYLGFSAGLDFETKIMVKEDAPALVRKELAARSWQPQPIGIGSATDAYQPIERKTQLTRRCLEVLAECRNPAGIVTKNALVTRDADLLGELARFRAAVVFLSVTTLDGELARRMEPRASQPAARLRAVTDLAAAGIPVGVLVAPIIPGLNDHEIPAILQAAKDAGAGFAAMTLVRLQHGLGDLFAGWLGQHFPDRKDKVLGRIRELHGGQLNDSRFGVRMTGEGRLAETIRQLFHLGCRRAGLATHGPGLSAAHFRPPRGPQPLLFDLDG